MYHLWWGCNLVYIWNKENKTHIYWSALKETISFVAAVHILKIDFILCEFFYRDDKKFCVENLGFLHVFKQISAYHLFNTCIKSKREFGIGIFYALTILERSINRQGSYLFRTSGDMDGTL